MTTSLSGSQLNKVSNLLYEFSIPLGLTYMIQDVITSTQNDPNTPEIPVQRAPREWFSQPRPCTDSTIEVLTVNLKQPSTVSALAFQVLQVPCNIQAWYQDRHHNWIQLTDTNNNPISVNVNYSAVSNWYSFETNLYSVVATAVQFRIQRNAQAVSQMGNSPYVVGLQQTLISRHIFNITDTAMAIEPQQDSMGNNISSYVKNWQPYNAIDNNPGTYWKSFPCPDPMGVVSYYMDIRDPFGNPQLIDTIYIDPVYTGNSLNVYYSNDPTQGTLIISPCNMPPDFQINSTWTSAVGMSDSSPSGAEYSQLLFPSTFGPLIEQPVWIGIEWTPNFSSGSPPVADNYLLYVSPGIDTIQTVTIEGAPTGGTFTLTYQNKTTASIAYNASAATVQTALQALTTIGTGNCTVYAEQNGGPYVVTFVGALAMQDIVALGASGAALTGGSLPSVNVAVTTIGSPVPNPGSDLYWPSVYYNSSAGEIVLSFTNNTNTYSWNVPLSPALQANVPYQIVVGWAYNPSTVFISVTQNGTTVVGTTTVNPATNLPTNITLDGELGYVNYCGLMTALVVKQDLWSNGYQAFQSAATIYANPGPVQPDSNGNYPSTSLDNAILAVDWTSQQFPIGGTAESWYENKQWTPVFANYTTQKGPLFLPQKVSASFVKLEFYNLTPEPYPVYDQGIQVTYDKFPVSVLTSSSSSSTSSSTPTSSPLTLSSDILSNSIGSVNWFNPSTIQNAINANWGVTQPAVQVTSGPGTLTQSLPNISQSNVSASYRSEQSSPWIFNRSMLNPTFLVGQALSVLSNGSTTQTIQSTLSTSAAALGSGVNGATSAITNTVTSSLSGLSNAASQLISNAFTPVTTTSKSNVLGQMGSNWWLFPGANLKMPANLMQMLTGTSTVVGRGPSTGNRYRFSTTSVHRYTQSTLTMDAAVAYFAGLSEVQCYVSSYVSANNPPSFAYSQYDPHTFTYTNIDQLSSGPLTTQGSPYQLQNGNFLYPLELSPWTATGNWTWDPQNGIGSNLTSGGVPCASIVANGNPDTLVSEPIPVAPGAQILATAYVAYYNATSSSGQLSISLIAYNSGTPTNVTLNMPTTTATYTVATQAAMLALSGVTIGQSCTITGAAGGYQGTYILTATPASTFSNWEFTGYGTYVNNPTGNINGELFIGLNGTYTVPGSGVDHIALVLNVTSGVTAGNIYFDNAQLNPIGGIEGTVFLNAITTSTFADLAVNVSDSGLMNSDGMWAREDPLDTNISNLQLAPYVTTFPGIIPAGSWDDTFATWDSPNIEWGEPIGVVAITVDPNIVFNNNRAMHFLRAAGAGEAGVLMTQQTNLLPQELVQMGCTFYKTGANANQITLALTRVSDGVVVWTETFNPVVGYWFTYLSAFFQLPNVYDQVYSLSFMTTGNAQDELYLADLYLNVAGIRYFVQLGGTGTNFDVTPLAYGGYANVSSTLPVNEFALTVGVFNPDSWAYGISLTPHYLVP